VKQLLIALALITLLATGSPVLSATVEGLYNLRVPVETREREDRSEAIKQAMETILIRMTGDGSIAQNPEVSDVIRGASGFVRRFQYFPTDDAYELQIDFDESRLTKNIANRGLPVWGRERPSVLAWIAVSGSGSRYLVGSNQPRGTRNVLKQRAELRGIPLTLPVLDLEDRNAVQSGDVAGGFYDTIEGASKRYGADSLLVGYARQSRSLWTVKWRLKEGAQVVVYESDGRSLASALEQGIDLLASNLAAWHATQGFTDQEEYLLLSVHDVQTLGDYFRVRDYLAGLDAVSKVVPDMVQIPEVRLRVSMRGTARNLERLIMLSDVLEADRGPQITQPGQDASELNYRLLR